ncbi:MAG: AMIN domain-containing protein, partial [Thermoanaerobaculia bacterium]
MAFAAVSAAAALGCATARHHDATGATAPATAASSESPAANPSPAKGRIEQASFTEDSDGARLVLSADAPILYTAYEPRPDLLVLDLPGLAVADSFAAPPASGQLVKSVRFEPVTELGKSLTRVSIEHEPGGRYDVRTLGQGLAVAFEGAPAASAAAQEPLPAALPVESVAAAELPPPAPAPIPAARIEIGHTLEEVTAHPSQEGVEVALLGDGALAAKDFVLSNPPRIVVDLPGVKNEVRRRVVPVESAMVSRVRISQFQTQPELVTRIVVDLTAPTAYSLRADGERLSLRVGRVEVADASPTAPARMAAPLLSPAPAPAEKLVPSERPVEAVTASTVPAPSGGEAEPPVEPAPPAAVPAPAEPKQIEPPSVTRVAEPPPEARSVETPVPADTSPSVAASRPAAAAPAEATSPPPVVT